MFGADRSLGVTEALHGALPEVVVVLFAVLTQLGDVWFLTLLGTALFLGGDAAPRFSVDRDRGLFVLGVVLAYLALVGVLKQFFLLPRPPGAGDPPTVAWLPAVLDGVLADVATGDGPGFPSGHALGTTMVWGGVALVVGDEAGRRTRLGVAAGVAGLVSLSRLLLGVHYLVDVVAGALVGALTLAALYALADRGTAPGRVLLVAAAIAVVSVVQVATVETVATAGSAAGAWLGWRAVADATPAGPASRPELAAAVAVFALASALAVLASVLEPPLVVASLLATVAGAVGVAAPLAGARLDAWAAGESTG
jgi:membrane-associated phospholipid phosphatase